MVAQGGCAGGVGAHQLLVQGQGILQTALVEGCRGEMGGAGGRLVTVAAMS